MASTLYLTLAELYYSAKLSESGSSSTPTKSPDSPKDVSVGGAGGGAGEGGGGGRERSSSGSNIQQQQQRSCDRDTRMTWRLIKSAQSVHTAKEALRVLTSAADSPAMTRPLSKKLLQELPDFVVSELCAGPGVGVGDEEDSLIAKTVVLPLESLVPSKQQQHIVLLRAASLNWFRIVNYYSRLIQRCYWHRDPLQLHHSDWYLHHHAMTGPLHVKARILLKFLTKHCPAIKGCLLPTPPTYSTHVKNDGGASHDPHMTAEGMEVTILWHSIHCPSPLEATPTIATPTGRLAGYFAMSQKPVSSYGGSGSAGLCVFILHTTLGALTDLHQLWQHVAALAADYLAVKAGTRPVSRSPVKQRKTEKAMQPPEELVKGVAETVRNTALLFNCKGGQVRGALNRVRNIFFPNLFCIFISVASSS